MNRSYLRERKCNFSLFRIRKEVHGVIGCCRNRRSRNRFADVLFSFLNSSYVGNDMDNNIFYLGLEMEADNKSTYWIKHLYRAINSSLNKLSRNYTDMTEIYSIQVWHHSNSLHNVGKSLFIIVNNFNINSRSGFQLSRNNCSKRT